MYIDVTAVSIHVLSCGLLLVAAAESGKKGIYRPAFCFYRRDRYRNSYFYFNLEIER